MKTTSKKPTKKQLASKVESLDADEVLGLISPKLAVLGLELDLTIEQLINEVIEETSDTFSHEGSEYKVLTDSEADEMNDELIDQYVDECILPDINERYRSYFDYEAFRRDARMDGRGHTIATYDGEERKHKFNDEWYFVYQTN